MIDKEELYNEIDDAMDLADLNAIISEMSDSELLALAEETNLFDRIEAESKGILWTETAQSDLPFGEDETSDAEDPAGPELPADCTMICLDDEAVPDDMDSEKDADKIASPDEDIAVSEMPKDLDDTAESQSDIQLEATPEEQAKSEPSPKKNKKKNIFFTLMLVFFAGFFVFSAYKLITIKIEMKKAADNYSQLAEEFYQDVPEDPTVQEEDPITNAQRFEPLLKINPDLAAWIYIEGTNINYPVVYSADQEYYLDHDFYGNYSINGTLFIGRDCDLKSDNIIIYGHCMKDGSMFNNLLNYEDWDFYNTHRSFQIDTVDGTFQYDIVAVFLERIHRRDEEGVFRYYNYTGSLTKQSYDEYVGLMRSVSYYDTGIVPQHGQQLITLSTCHYSDENARLVVVGVLR